jgi:RNA polymerase sigma-70 factor (ECF subfamily)
MEHAPWTTPSPPRGPAGPFDDAPFFTASREDAPSLRVARPSSTPAFGSPRRPARRGLPFRRRHRGRCGPPRAPGAPIRPWLLGVARHVAIDLRRSRGRDGRRQDADAGTIDAIPASRLGPFEDLAKARLALQVRQALARLPAGPRQALTLFYLDGLAYDDIAQRLAVPSGTVATWLARGRQALKAELDATGDDR